MLIPWRRRPSYTSKSDVSVPGGVWFLGNDFHGTGRLWGLDVRAISWRVKASWCYAGSRQSLIMLRGGLIELVEIVGMILVTRLSAVVVGLSSLWGLGLNWPRLLAGFESRCWLLYTG